MLVTYVHPNSMFVGASPLNLSDIVFFIRKGRSLPLRTGLKLW